MKKLLIYFSLTGNGDMVAEYLSKNGYEIRKVIEKKKSPKSFFFRVMSGGFRAGLKLKGKLIDYNNDVSEYDEIVIGTPVWNGRFPPAINSVLAMTDLSNKKITFVFYCGSGDMPKVHKDILKRFGNVPIIVLKEPKTHEGEFEKLKDL